jgi:hypothetical protein
MKELNKLTKVNAYDWDAFSEELYAYTGRLLSVQNKLNIIETVTEADLPIDQVLSVYESVINKFYSQLQKALDAEVYEVCGQIKTILDLEAENMLYLIYGHYPATDLQKNLQLLFNINKTQKDKWLQA